MCRDDFLQPGRHLPHLFCHSDDSQKGGDQFAVVRVEQKFFEALSIFVHLARTTAVQMKPAETSR